MTSPFSFTVQTWSWAGPTYGVAWGRVDGDLFPDLYLNNHGDSQNLLLTYDAETSSFRQTVIRSQVSGDEHGVAFGDFDNDGDQDLLEMTGGGLGLDPGNMERYADHFYVNEGGVLVESAAEYGLTNGVARGRDPLWFDFDRDGDLDVFFGASARPDGLWGPTVYLNEGASGFTAAPELLPLGKAQTATFADLNGDGKAEVVVSGGVGSGPIQFLDGATYVAGTFSTKPVAAGSDMVFADFNNDLRPDLYVGVQNDRTGIDRLDAGTIRYAVVSPASAPESEVRFHATGAVTFDFRGDDNLQLSQLNLGGLMPADLVFTVGPGDPRPGMPQLPPDEVAVAIGYDEATGEWVIRSRSAPLRAAIIQADQIVDYRLDSSTLYATSAPDRLYLNIDGALKQVATFEGGTESIGAGDFDNDMDVDLYLARSGPSGDLVDYILENAGTGSFITRSAAEFGFGPSRGLSSAVAVADYNMDGFLDVLSSDGGGTAYYTPDGGYQLLTNGGNGNHWVELDLLGIESNRDGIGAQVFVTAGGVTQMRTVGAGVHGKAQDSGRVHLGLGANTTIDRLEIVWTNGRHQVIDNLDANELYRVVEADSASLAQARTGDSTGNLLSGGGGKDTLSGLSGDDLLIGGAGADRMIGGEGDDSYRVDHVGDGVVEFAAEGLDTVFASVSHTLKAQVENLTLTGAANTNGSGNDLGNLLIGNSGVNYLKGLGGSDTLEGGAGPDRLFGGDGSDVFRFTAVSQSGSSSYDRVMDLTEGDIIDLSAIDANSMSGGDQEFQLVTGFHGRPGELLLTWQPAQARTLLRGDVDGDRKVDFLVVLAGEHMDFSGFVW